MIAHHNNPGDAEAAAAIAGLADTYGYHPSPGDRVACERPFRGDYAEGVVAATNGVYVLVDVDGENLAYYPHELRLISRAN